MLNKNSEWTMDYFERREAFVQSVVEMFYLKVKDRKIDPEIYQTRRYVIWIEANEDVYDGLIRKNERNVTLIKELMDELYNKNIVLGSLEIYRGKPESDLEHIQKMKAADIIMYLEEKALVTASTSQQIPDIKARITLAPGSPGRLVKPKGYKIDNKHAPYNIGRVVKPGSSINRINHIEIIDETLRVSRIHAHIDYDDKGGFFIQKDVNPKGTNLTVIMRKGDDDFELRGSAKRYLKNGDTIVLSNTVWLAFHLVK